jgi:uncharacterized protein YpmB
MQEKHPLHAHKKQKPASVVVLFTFILLCVITGGILMIKSSTSPTPTKEEEVVCQYDENVCGYLTKLDNPQEHYKGSFTASITTTEKDGKESLVIIKSDGGRNLNVISYNKDILVGESTIYDNTVYVRDLKTNTWTKTDTIPNEAFIQLKQRSLREVNKSGSGVSYTLLGTAKCGKKTCFKYQLKTPTTGETKTYVLFTMTQHMLKEVITISPENLTTDTLFVYNTVEITPPPIQ